jgi:hypothetical protein
MPEKIVTAATLRHVSPWTPRARKRCATFVNCDPAREIAACAVWTAVECEEAMADFSVYASQAKITSA